MTDEESIATSQPSTTITLEPEQTGATPNAQTTPTMALVSALPVDAARKGLSTPNVLTAVFEAILTQGTQAAAEVSKVFVGDYEGRFNSATDKVEKLQDALRLEQVAHARTEERLKSLLEKDRKSTFITGLGGVLLGLGLKEFEPPHGKIFAGVGLALMVVGCWALFPKRLKAWAKE